MISDCRLCTFGITVACVAALLDGGANPTQTNLSGHKPADYSRSDAMKKLLESYATKYENRMKEREAEEKRKFPLEKRLKEKIIGQETAIAAVAAGNLQRYSYCTFVFHSCDF